MSEKGFVALWRSLMKWKWYKSPNVKNLFIHMLLRANYEDEYWDGKRIPRGSFVSSIGGLAYETGLTVDEVRTALKKLLEEEVTKQSTNKYTVYTVVNYEYYQSFSQATPKQDPSNAQTIPKLFPTIKQSKQANNKNNKDITCKADASALFEKLWKQYPNKKGKGQVSDSAKKRLLDVGEEEMIRAIERYKKHLKNNADWLKPQNGSTFFNSGYIDYLDSNYEESKPSQSKGNTFTQFQQNDYDFDSIEQKLLAKK